MIGDVQRKAEEWTEIAEICRRHGWVDRDEWSLRSFIASALARSYSGNESNELIVLELELRLELRELAAAVRRQTSTLVECTRELTRYKR